MPVLSSIVMSMGILLSLLGSLWWLIAVMRGGWAWALGWVGSAFLLVGISYLLRRPAVFGKRQDGSLPLWRSILILPYLLMTWGIWHAKRLLSREPAHVEFMPGVLIGRRLTAGEWPEDTSTILDLTSEFSGSRPPGDSAEYVCFPILDRCAPDPAELIRVLRLFDADPAGLCIHCAEGHGRTALAAAILLLMRDEHLEPGEAIARVKVARPRAWLAREQEAALRAAHQLLLGGHAGREPP